MKTTLAEPHRLPPSQSGSSSSLPGAFTLGGQELVLRTNDYGGEKGGGGRGSDWHWGAVHTLDRNQKQ